MKKNEKQLLKEIKTLINKYANNDCETAIVDIEEKVREYGNLRFEQGKWQIAQMF